VPTHVALLRGINVGGRNPVPVAALREVVLGVGHSEVATYIQSGNVGFTSEEADTARIAAALERAIAMHLGVRPRVVVLTRAELAQVVANNPFPDEPNPRWVHAIFRNGPLGPDELAAVAAAQQRARDEGSDDEARVVGTTLFLHAPGGLGRSELAGQVVANPTSGSVTPPQRHHAFPFPDAAVTLEAGPMSPLPAARGRAARSGCARTLPRRRYRCTLAPGSCRSRARRPVV
jgi:uncharacterized protein (DUF1697 family)